MSITYDTIGNPLNWRNDFTFTRQNGRDLRRANQKYAQKVISLAVRELNDLFVDATTVASARYILGSMASTVGVSVYTNPAYAKIALYQAMKEE